MTLREMYADAVGILDEAGVESPSVDAFYLLEYITGIDRTSYLLNKDLKVREDIVIGYENLIQRRAEHEPYQYITGEADFMGYLFKVTPDVLIPRLDTEVLAEETINLVKEHQGAASVLDLCTGSGCLAVSIKKECPDALVNASDISDKALKIAKANAFSNEAEITFWQSDLFEAVPDEKFDIIVSNPPYVTDGEYETLMPEVKEHEPRLALTAGADGLDIYKRIAAEAGQHLKTGGWLIMEIGCEQAEAVKKLLENNGFLEISVTKDLAGLDRVVRGRN